MTDLIELVESLPPDHQVVAAKVLDACSRPLTVREIETLLRRQGVTKTRAVKLAGALKGFAVIAVVGPEEDRGRVQSSQRPDSSHRIRPHAEIFFPAQKCAIKFDP